ncbi:GNAT family N-acetyltransferase [Photobacterium sp. CAU 1568]|uniref:GNAT family N-acetyltransferase n=1 Tax=Photobacterium arenosum TaxID=2774143 RepID=A0ABR9BI17_9GAMM|nr:GNAT family N-acetyltransferase [Photobacterium arenosum]MBD8512200.1 GNAT family N-acetyltransferase [Photobacterium arenosum]
MFEKLKRDICQLQTERLIIRQWKEDDNVPFAAMCADPNVMRYFPATLSEDESVQLAHKATSLIQKNGWGFWAVERKDTGQFIGLAGLHYQDLDIPDTPFIEIGWRLAADQWGKGFAPEAAQRALSYAFDELQAPAVYAFTTLANQPSRRVMQKLGMSDCQKNFMHPKLPHDHSLAEHCLYRITRQEWLMLNTPDRL